MPLGDILVCFSPFYSRIFRSIQINFYRFSKTNKNTKKTHTMNIPQDPMILYSFINMKLRDYYPSLDALCEDLDIEKSTIISSLQSIGYEYNPESNQFNAGGL